MSDNVILTEIDGATATLTINRPKTLNALDIPTLLALAALLLTARLLAKESVLAGR